MKQINDFPASVQQAANQYVSAYLQASSMRDAHLRMMQTLDNSPDLMCRQLAECIDLLFWEREQRQALEIAEELDAWAPDHEQWAVMH